MLTAIEAVAALIVSSWVWINLYHFYPMLMTVLEGESDAERTTESDEKMAYSDGGQPSFEPDGGTPSIDILLPAYKEGTVIEHSIASIRDANYDQRRINVNVLVEPDDDETREVLDAIDDEYEFREIVVPEAYPGDPNKPRALNYAFERTDAEVVTIVDAEDAVHPDLYDRVVDKLMTGSDYVQGRLDMANEDDGWMNTLFRAEYGYWYEINTRAKYHRDYPIPLGGTTCFFPRTVLEEISDRRFEKYGRPWDEDEQAWIDDHDLEGFAPWDPNNVTEDFELGLFLWQEGYEAGYVESTPTKEESPLSLDAWMRQRTRWKKGKIYTFLHYLRHPPDGIREKMHIYSQSGVPHLGPVNLTSVVVLLLAANLLGYQFAPATKTVLTTAFGFTLGMIGLYSFGYWTVTDRPRLTKVRRTVVVAVTLVVYWLMQWLADIRAISQTYKGELHWAKTTHFGRHLGGLSGIPETAGDSDRWTLPQNLRFGLLVGVLTAGVAARLYGLTSRSLWADELFSVVGRASLPIPELLTVSLTVDPHPPLYYLVLHYWMAAFGNSVASVRLLSIVLALFAMGLLFRLGTEIFNDRVGLLATLLFALAPFHIHYGRQARMYSLFALLTIASWYGFVRLRNESTVTTVGYVAATVLLIYTHAYGLFVVAAQYVYVLLSERKAGIDVGEWVSVQAVVTALSLPWLVLVGKRVVGLAAGATGQRNVIGHLPPPSLGSVKHTLLRFSGLPSHYPVYLRSDLVREIAIVLAFLFACLLVFAWMRYAPDRRYEFTTISSASQLSLLLFIPVVVPIVVSQFVTPIYSARFALPASIALFLLVARGLLNVGHPKLRTALVLVAVAGLAMTAGAYHGGDSVEDWRGEAGCLQAHADGDDAVLYQPFWLQEWFEYYNGQQSAVRHGVLPPKEIASKNVSHARNLDEVRSLADRFGTLWVVREGFEESRHLLDALNQSHDLVARTTGQKPHVYKYVNGTQANGSTHLDDCGDDATGQSFFPGVL